MDLTSRWGLDADAQIDKFVDKVLDETGVRRMIVVYDLGHGDGGNLTWRNRIRGPSQSRCRYRDWL